MLGKDLLSRYHESVVEVIATEDFGYSDVRDWAGDYNYCQCQDCGMYVYLDCATSDDGGGTWTCDHCDDQSDRM